MHAANIEVSEAKVEVGAGNAFITNSYYTETHPASAYRPLSYPIGPCWMIPPPCSGSSSVYLEVLVHEMAALRRGR